MAQGPDTGDVLPKLKDVFSADFLARVEEAKKFPIPSIEQIHSILEALNTKAIETGYEFHLQPVVDGVVPPNVAPYYILNGELTQPYKLEATGQVVQAMLDSLPPSIREGKDDFFEVHQIRLNQHGSWEQQMGTTTLLAMYLHSKHEGGKCYVFADDQDSFGNWQRIENMHNQHFPQLPTGQQ